MNREQEAARYIQERLKLEQIASDNLKRLLKSAASEIVKISSEYNISPSRFRFSANRKLKKRVDAVIEQLIEAIISDARTLVLNGENDDERKNAILAWFLSVYYGMTFVQRVKKNVSSFLVEVEGAVAASKHFGYSVEKTSSLIGLYLAAPFTSPLLSEVAGGNYRTEASLGFRGGSGTYASSFKNLDRVITDQVARTVQRKYYELDHGTTTHWQVVRGSSYPCSLCDSCCGIVTGTANLPPFHPRCCCIAIPLD